MNCLNYFSFFFLPNLKRNNCFLNLNSNFILIYAVGTSPLELLCRESDVGLGYLAEYSRSAHENFYS